jgi:hypothetical protein
VSASSWVLAILAVALTSAAVWWLRPRWAASGAPGGVLARLVEWAGLTAACWVANVLLGTGIALACRALGFFVSSYAMGDIVVLVIAALQAIVVMGEGR